MSAYTLQFGTGGDSHEAPIELDAVTLEQAKVHAAMLYAGASFKRAPPTSFRILKDGSAEVYRFPERD
jgi:hypothetical protein